MLLKENLLLEKELNNWYSNNELNINDTEVEFIFSQSYEWINNEKQFLSDLNKSKLTILSTLDERNRVLKNHLSSEFRVPDTVKLEDLKELLDTYLDKLNVLKNRLAFIDVQLLNHHKSLEKNDKYSKEINLKSVYVDNWRKLNDLFGSADGAKFKLIAQGYTLDILLGYANSHLRNITHRYVLERVNEYSLSLQVIDLDMLSEVRSVHSLSGGESFLISLSLALGLSSLSSNKMRIESLFIDEGFGSLDADTLGVAMDALEKLQTQGRKIGVISHVAEMSERIGTQIKVVKQSNGKSIIIIE